MTLAETLLPKLADWGPADAPASLTHHDPATGRAVTVTADRADTLGCLVRELAVSADTASSRPPLGERAARVAAAATGLLEPLSVYEVDDARGEALLRSSKPAVRGDAVLYYEARLAADGSAALRRYQTSKSAGGRRQAVPFALTHEAVAKLAADLAA